MENTKSQTADWFMSIGIYELNLDLADLKSTGIIRFPFCNLTTPLPSFIDKQELVSLLKVDGISAELDKNIDEIFIYKL